MTLLTGALLRLILRVMNLWGSDLLRKFYWVGGLSLYLTWGPTSIGSATTLSSAELVARSTVRNPTLPRQSWTHSVSPSSVHLGGGGYITGLWGDGSQNVIATTDNAGVFASTDGGLQWRSRNSGLTLLESEAVRSAAMGSDTRKNLWIATGNRGLGVENISGIQKWDARGRKWIPWAGMWVPGADTSTHSVQNTLSFDGAFNAQTHTRAGRCNSGSSVTPFRTVSAGPVLLEGKGKCSGTSSAPLYVATLEHGVQRYCAERWETAPPLPSGIEFTSLLELKTGVILAGAIPSLENPSSQPCALSLIDFNRSPAKVICLAPATITEARDLSLLPDGRVLVAGGPTGVWAIRVNPTAPSRSSHSASLLIDPSVTSDCLVDPEKSGVFTSVDVARNGWIAASHLGGSVLISKDSGRSWTRITRDQKRLNHPTGLVAADQESTLTVSLGLDEGTYHYSPRFLASVAAVHWIHENTIQSQVPTALLASDFFSVWKLHSSTWNAVRTSFGIENTVTKGIAVAPSGERALVAKMDAPLVGEISASGSPRLIPLTPGTGGLPRENGTCFDSGQVDGIVSLVWPRETEAFLLGYRAGELKLCTFDGSSFESQSHSHLPPLGSQFALGYDETDSNVLFIAQECSLYRGTRPDAESTTWTWSQVYPSSEGLPYACRSTANARQNLSGVDETLFARVLRVGESRLGAAQLGDRVVVTLDGGLTWRDWNKGLFDVDHDSKPIGYSPFVKTNLRLTSMQVHAESDHLAVYVGTSAACRSFQPYSAGIPCPSTDFEGGLYKRRLPLAGTSPSSASASESEFQNLINWSGTPNLTDQGNPLQSMVSVRDIAVIDSARIIFASDSQGKNTATGAGVRQHSGGIFITGDGGRQWTQIADPRVTHTVHFNSLGVNEDGSVLWAGSRSNGFSRFELTWE